MKCILTWLLLVVVSAPLRAQDSYGDGLEVHAGAVNRVVVERNGNRLAVYGDLPGQDGPASIVLLTHARRDVTWAARELLQAGGKAIVPARELELVNQPDQFWSQWREGRFHDYAQQSTKLPVEPIPVARSVQGGDVVEWEGLTFHVLDTPGYTRGAVSYVVDLAGRKVAFTGDLIRDDGKLQDLFSLQDGIPEAKIGGYHGWAGRLGDLVASLRKVAAEKPDLLVPARGPVIDDPPAAIERLQARIRAAYANYLSIDALRWYFGDDHIRTKARRVMGPDAQVDWMPMADTAPLPTWIRAISNSRLIIAADGAGFQVDCGGTGIIDELKKLRDAGTLTSLEHVFVTHYHDDHTDAVPALVDEFGSRVHACASLIDVLERPGDYRLPCLTRNPIRVTAPRRDGESWRWREFQFTIYDFPGQTLHHNALLVQRDGGEAVLFAGDSFTPSGIDDYCLQNRNFVGPERGLARCLDLLATLPAECWVINQHVEPMFRFSPEQISRMRDTLLARGPLLLELLPYDDPNFGLDEGWAVVHPYAVRVRPEETVPLQLRITNHSPRPRTFRTVAHAPPGFQIETTESTSIEPRSDGALTVEVTVPAGTAPGLHVLTVDVAWEDGELRQWAEALIEVLPSPRSVAGHDERADEEPGKSASWVDLGVSGTAVSHPAVVIPAAIAGDPLLAEAYRQAAERNVLRALNSDVFFGYFSVCADGQGHGGNTTFPGLDWGQSAEALLWLGRRAEVLASWEYVKRFQREDGLLPFAILPDLAGQTVLAEGKYPLTAEADGAVFRHWVPGNPLRTLANVTFLLLADAIHDQTGDQAWLDAQVPSLRRAADWLLAQITPEGLIRGGGFYVERPTRLEFDGVNQCYSVHALQQAARLLALGGDPEAARRCRAGATTLTEAFRERFWAGDRCVEYIHPERGPISHHGLTDVDWAAVATGVASAEQIALLWPQLKENKGFLYGGVPGGIATQPERYEDWEMQYIDRHDVAAMGRVWYLECWARARMGDREGILRSLRRVAEVGQANDWSWMERYYSERTGDLGKYHYAHYCEYPANLIRIVHRFLEPSPGTIRTADPGNRP